MKKISIALAVISLGANLALAQEKSTGKWENLLKNGNTTAWHTYGKSYAGKAWSVEDGVLHLNTKINDGSQRGDLTTNEAFGDFHLKLDWKISQKGNSGIIFLVDDDASKYGESYFTGPEMQVLDNDGHPDAKIPKHRAGDLYDLIASSKETVKPAGEWNHAEIIVKNSKLTLILNGTKVVETKMWNQHWKDLIAGSKFKDMKDFGTLKTGKLVLQDHGNDVWYRNIYIKKL